VSNIVKIPGVKIKRKPGVIYYRGRPFEVVTETVEFPNSPPPRVERQKNRFVQLTHADAVAGFKALNCPVALVWYALLYRAWAEKSDAVKVPTTLLRSWGVHRLTWIRAVNRLERAGLIQTQRQRGRAVICYFMRPAAPSCK
jgi:hypothetical protein